MLRHNKYHLCFGARPALGLVLLLSTWSVWHGLGLTAAPANERQYQGGVSVHEADDSAFMPLVIKPAAPSASGLPAYGVVFVSSAEAMASEQQYQNGLATGATWNRWPIYWFYVEKNLGDFDWQPQDATVQADVAHGLQINAILLGTPPFYTTATTTVTRPPTPAPGTLALQAPQAATPLGLYLPVFSDGTDVPGPGKQVNESNVWARFVYTAVNRYKPGGVLAKANGWPAGAGVTHWEMWNEPDLDFFWDSSVADYARLLKAGYLAAKQADANAQVMFGGLANNFAKLGYYNDVMTIFDGDPLAAEYAYFHDILATHNYTYAWRSWYHVWRASQTLAARNLSKPIWLNESGVPAWDDYPGPTWEPTSPLRASMSEQADFAVQSALYATYAGADTIFHFQLYDGCGNQPAGTDFPPHSGELCDANGKLIDDPRYPCAGDANGLFRNPAGASCFRQHAQPETPRPVFTAFRMLTTHFTNVEPLWWLRPGAPSAPEGTQEWIAFYRPATGERIVGLWARFGVAETAVVPATGSSGLLLAPDGLNQGITPVNGAYTLQLPAATNRNAFWDPSLYPIGGRPYLLIERDTLPPAVTISGPSLTDGAIPFTWSGDDGLGSGLASFDVAVAIDGGAAQSWLQGTTATGGTYPGEPGHGYTFYVTAEDRAGNVSPPATLTVQVVALDEQLYLPLIVK